MSTPSPVTSFQSNAKKGEKMNYELVKSEIHKSNNDKRGSLYIDYKPADIFDAGDVVRALLKHTSDVSVEWEDNGDCGMKNGGCCKGQEFDYPGLGFWPDTFWVIKAVYNGTTMHFYTYTDQQNISDTVSANIFFENMEEISEAQLKELQNVTIPKLLGWVSDQEADE